MFFLFIQHMKIEILYSEISNYIKNTLGTNLNITYISPTRIQISQTIVRADLIIVERRKSSIDVVGENLSVAAKLLLPRIENIEGIDRLGGYKFAIRFGQMDVLKEFFKVMELVKVEFCETGIKIETKERDV